MGEQPSILRDIYEHVARKVSVLQQEYLNNSSWGKQQLAHLRHGDMTAPGVDSQLWEIVFVDMPDSLIGHTDDPSRAELAVHAALVLYAVHQQSQSDPMHRPGVHFGRAVQHLARVRGQENDPDQGTIDRFHQLCAQQGLPMRLRSLRSLVTLMRSEQVGFDYAQLAIDLYLIQNKKTVNKVLLQWGRDFHVPFRRSSTDTTQDSTSSAHADTTTSKEN